MRIESWRGRPRGSRKEARPSRHTRKRGGVIQRKERRWARGMTGRGKSEKGVCIEGGKGARERRKTGITFATFATS